MPNRRKGLEQPLLSLTNSTLATTTQDTSTSWLTSPSYQQSSLSFTATAFHSVVDALLENPNLNSSHLFRANIVVDSAGILKTNQEKEDFCGIEPDQPLDGKGKEKTRTDGDDKARPPLTFVGFELRRTVLRRLIPRKPQLDRSLLQTCHIYTSDAEHLPKPDETICNGVVGEEECARQSSEEKLNNGLPYKQSVARHRHHLVVYQPHADPSTGSDMPWYHPPLKFLAFLFSLDSPSHPADQKQSGSTLSVHFQFFPGNASAEGPLSITDRIHRTLLSLLSTFVRLARNTPVHVDTISGEEKARPISATQHIKDNIVPEHLVQDTYTRLKTLYAADLINRWVEKTDPTKHVFEDLSIAAFLIELWRRMYGGNFSNFRGFVDIACGNGVLVYILIKEGFRGWGFDARARRTWSIFPETVTAHLKETVCIPKPFLEALQSQKYALQEDLPFNDGIFERDTFIISNHADELSTWTPLLAVLSCPESPLPWLAIPCCSHALSGAPYRYQSSIRQTRVTHAGHDIKNFHCGDDALPDDDQQPQTGDLAALRASRDQNRACLESGKSSAANSMYASLVHHVIYLAKSIDPTEDVQQTLMRIPSTRNIGVVGGQQRILRLRKAKEPELVCRAVTPKQSRNTSVAELERLIYDIVEQECVRSGGVAKAAEIWMESVKKARGVARQPFRSRSG